MKAAMAGMQPGMQPPMQRVAGGVAGVAVAEKARCLLPNPALLSIGCADFASRPRSHNHSEDVVWGGTVVGKVEGMGAAELGGIGLWNNNNNGQEDLNLICVSGNGCWQAGISEEINS